MFPALAHGFLADLKTRSLPVAVLRALRASRLLACSSAARAVARNSACARHAAAVAPHDPAFFLAHRHFLAKGLGFRQRAASAACHYAYETERFDRRYFDAVYRGAGLVLWCREVDGQQYDIRLLPGNDVLYEGGASVVFHHNGRRAYVISYSWVPTSIVLPGAGDRSGPTLFVTRKHAAADHDYQKAFNKAFDRTTPGHLCFAALAGLAQAAGHAQIVAIDAAHQPASKPEYAARFQTAYDEFWQSLHGQPDSPFGYRIALPMHMTPLDELDAKARKRAIARRAHIEEVRASACEVMGPRIAAAVAPAQAAVAAQPELEVAPSWALLGRF